MYREAQQPFLRLINKHRPGRILVLGIEAWDKMPDTDIHLARDVQAYRLTDGSLAWCLALGHPTGPLWLGWETANKALTLFRNLRLPRK